MKQNKCGGVKVTENLCHIEGRNIENNNKNKNKNKIFFNFNFNFHNVEETKEAIKKSKSSKAIGPDGLSNLYLKHLGP